MRSRILRARPFGRLCVLSATGGNGPGTVSNLTSVPAWNQSRIDETAALRGFDQAYFPIHIVHQGGGLEMFFHQSPWLEGFAITLMDQQPPIQIGQQLVDTVLAKGEPMMILSRRSDPSF